MKKLHGRVKDQIERKNKSYAKQANKGRKKGEIERKLTVNAIVKKEREKKKQMM